MNKLKEEYINRIKREVGKELKLDNVNSIPTLVKIVVNSGVKSNFINNENMDALRDVLQSITGQVAVVTKARESISNFHIREGMEIGFMVTLRGRRMWDFFEKVVSVVFPRFRDFRGLSLGSLDGHGNYTIGIKDHTVFPEVATKYIDRVKSLQITIVTTAKDNHEAEVLLRHLGLPLQKSK